MPERKSRRPANDLIDGDQPVPSQGGTSGGDLSRDVGSRAELKQSLGEEPEPERVTGKDHPAANARKGRKALSRMQGGG